MKVTRNGEREIKDKDNKGKHMEKSEILKNKETEKGDNGKLESNTRNTNKTIKMGKGDRMCNERKERKEDMVTKEQRKER